MWGTGKIESTPHGHFAKNNAHPPLKEGELYGDFHDKLSHVNLDHFNIERGVEVVNKEFNRGRKTVEQMKTQAKSDYVDPVIVKAAGKITDVI